MKVLVIEDDKETAEYVRRGLTEHGHVVDVAEDGPRGLSFAAETDYDVLIVDRMLPHFDGLSLVKMLRESGSAVPILFLTTLGGVDDRVEGLNAGGDDYLSKPFAFSELLARVEALGRRTPMKLQESVLKAADLEMNLLTRSVTRAGESIDLQPREFRLLEVLLRNKGRIVTRTMLLEQVWEFHFEPKTSVVETLVSRLRLKLDKPFDADLIQTVRGIGYSINENP